MKHVKLFEEFLLESDSKKISEGFLDKLRDKAKALMGKKSEISGEGSAKKKEAIAAGVEKVKATISSVSDKVDEYEDKIYSLQVKIKKMDQQIEDDFDGDSSSDGAKKLMDAQEKMREEIKQLRAKKDKLSD